MTISYNSSNVHCIFFNILFGESVDASLTIKRVKQLSSLFYGLGQGFAYFYESDSWLLHKSHFIFTSQSSSGLSIHTKPFYHHHFLNLFLCPTVELGSEWKGFGQRPPRWPCAGWRSYTFGNIVMNPQECRFPHDVFLHP